MVTPSIENRTNYSSRMGDLEHAVLTTPAIQMMSDAFRKLILWMTKAKFSERASLDDIVNSEYLKDPYVKAIKHLE